MATLRRNLLLATVPAGALGALLAVLAATLTEPASTSEPPEAVRGTPEAPSGDGGVDAPSDADPPEPPRKRDRPGGLRSRRSRIDPRLVAQLEDASEEVRLRAAVELLRLGPSRLHDMYVLEPKRPESRALLSRVEEALGVLDQIEKGTDYGELPEENRLEVKLKHWGRAVPPELLRDERRRYWELRVEGDPERLRLRAIEPGEARWHELELAKVRRELGEIDEAVWKTLLDTHLPEVRAWADSLRTRREMSPARAAEISAAIAALQS